jgi:hypothetical protein
MQIAGELECLNTVLGKGDAEPGLVQEVGLEVANVGIAFYAQNDGATSRVGAQDDA